MINLITEILILFEEFKFWKKKKIRREKEIKENLPEKIMIHPVVWITIIGFCIIFLLKHLLIFFYPNPQESETLAKMNVIKDILSNEKINSGTYPKELTEIIRGNPLRKDINKDLWGNEFYYKQLNNGVDYSLISKGKDGILNTKDDISLK